MKELRDKIENMIAYEVSEALKNEPLVKRIDLLNDIDKRTQKGLNIIFAEKKLWLEPSYAEDKADAMWGGQNDDDQ